MPSKAVGLVTYLAGGGAPSSAPTAAMGWRAYWQAMDGLSVYSDAGVTLATNGQGAYRLAESLGVVANSYFEQATSAQRPIYTTGGAGGKSYLLFDPTDDNMASLAISNFFALGAKTVMLAANTYSSVTDTAVMVRDASSYLDFRTRTGPLIRWRNYSGAYQESTGGAFVLGTPFVYVAKHDSGSIYDAINGGAWTAGVVSGNTGSLAGALNLRAARYHFYAMTVSNVVISDANIAQCVTYFKSQLGIA